MKDQHKKISGYRDLTQDEIDLMNEAKELEARVLAFHSKIGACLNQQDNDAMITQDEAEKLRLDKSQARRWHSIARTEIETGFMALVRAIAQPQPKE